MTTGILLTCLGLVAPADLAEVADQLRTFRESWISIEVRSRETIHNHRGSYSVPMFQHYVETVHGQRMLDRAFVAHNTGRAVRYSSYCDGVRFADVAEERGRPRSVTIKRSFLTEGQSALRACGLPLSYLYLTQQPLESSLSRWTPLGQTNRLGRDCERILIRGARWTFYPVEMIYELDRATGLPMYVASYSGAARRTAEQPDWTWEARSLDKVEGDRLFPLHSVQREFAVKNGTSVEELERTIDVLELRFNQDYPASMFWPDTRSGSTVWDQIANVRTQVPGLMRDAKGAPVPVRVEKPIDWTGIIASGGIVLGLIVIVLGIVLRWRNLRTTGLRQ